MGEFYLMCLAYVLTMVFAIIGVVYLIKDIIRDTRNKSADNRVNASKWVLKTFDDGYGEYQLYECDKCGAVRAHRTNYCHNCGAKMESEVEDEKE